MKIHMISQPDCPWCEKAEQLLSLLGHEIASKTVLDSPAKKRAFKESGFETVPQIYVNGYLVGGFDALQAIVKKPFEAQFASPKKA